MAKIVVAGCSDCPYFAKVELLADRLKINLPNFTVHKIVKNRKEWETWSVDLCTANNWNIRESPIIWRELVDRGGKGHLIGGSNEFQEYVRCYYDIISEFSSDDMQKMALDNIRFKNEEDKENHEFKALSTPTKVCIVGAVNESVNHFVLSLGRGDVISPSTELSIVFLDQTNNLSSLKSLQMGTFDLAFPLVRAISITDDFEAALAESSIVVIFDIMEYNQNQEIKTWLTEQQDYYEYLGSLIDKYCPSHVKVLLVPNSANSLININLTSMHRMLQRIPKFNVVGLSRVLEQQVRAVTAKKLGVNPANVHNIVVWGNIGGKTYFDLKNARIHQYDGSVTGPEPFSLSVEKTIWDRKWLRNEMEASVDKRFNHISEMTGRNNRPLATATAIGSFLHQWINGDDNGYIHSLTVASEGWYNVPEGMVFSMPVTLNPKGYWTVVQDIECTEAHFKRINECMQDINEKIQILYPWMNNSNAAEMILDEKFIESQINALLEEIYPKEEISTIRSLINNSLMFEEKIEISRSKDLLISSIEDLRRPPATQETTIIESPKSEIHLNNEDNVVTVDATFDTVNNNSEEENENSETFISSLSKDDLEEDL